MKPGDLVEYNWGGRRKRGIVIEKSFFGWAIYFPKSHSKIKHLPEKALTRIQQPVKEK